MMTKDPQAPEKPSTLQWRGNAPVSNRFDDVYYSAENGLEETRFVFLRGVGYPEAFKQQKDVVIAETGFGTGLNFVATWQAWKEAGSHGTLTFISVEGYPLSEPALTEAHETFPEVSALAAELRQAWPAPSPGFHPRHFEGGKVRLILLFGDAATSFARLDAQVDAWYLDGFAPAKNPEMWSDALMDQIARLSRPGTRFATFTAAGFVRRALQARGFEVQKTPGYGRKRERLVGKAESPKALERSNPQLEWAISQASPEGRIAVIGAGIAGASVAAALHRRGRDVILVSHESKPCASHVPAAILSPRFMLEQNAASEFFTSAYCFSSWFPSYAGTWSETSGVTVIPKNSDDEKRLKAVEDALAWPADWLEPISKGLKLARGGSIDTAAALSAITKDIPSMQMAVARIEKASQSWRLCDDNGRTLEIDVVVVAAGIGTEALLAPFGCPELRPNRGQVELCAPPYPETLPDESLAYGGYVTAETEGLRTIGSTFDRLDALSDGSYDTLETDQRRILDQFEDYTGTDLQELRALQSWAGVRTTTPDHLPYAGPIASHEHARAQYAPLSKDAKITDLGAPELYPGLYMIAGLGSKGYQYGPILGEYLAAKICGEPLPLPSDLVPVLHPLRDLIRIIKRSAS